MTVLTGLLLLAAPFTLPVAESAIGMPPLQRGVRLALACVALLEIPFLLILFEIMGWSTEPGLNGRNPFPSYNLIEFLCLVGVVQAAWRVIEAVISATSARRVASEPRMSLAHLLIVIGTATMSFPYLQVLIVAPARMSPGLWPMLLIPLTLAPLPLALTMLLILSRRHAER
jgi:hypothetical protein